MLIEFQKKIKEKLLNNDFENFKLFEKTLNHSRFWFRFLVLVLIKNLEWFKLNKKELRIKHNCILYQKIPY